VLLLKETDVLPVSVSPFKVISWSVCPKAEKEVSRERIHKEISFIIIVNKVQNIIKTLYAYTIIAEKLVTKKPDITIGLFVW